MDDTDGEGDGHESLDLRGLKCPLAVLQTRRALKRLSAGRVLHIRCSDPLAGLDIPNLIRETGDILVDSETTGCESHFTVRKA